MRYITPLLCAVAIFGLTACSKNNQPAPQNLSACSGDPYLMKYGCSVSRVASAAENGDADAQYALGYMYYYGVDTVRDKDSAKLWISRAAAQGQPLAKSALAMLQGKQPTARTKSVSQQSAPILAQKKTSVLRTAQSAAKTTPVKSVTRKASKASRTPVRVAAKSPVKSSAPVKHLASDHVASVANTTSAHATESSDIVQMEARLMQEPTNGYTLQLMGNHNEGVIRDFVAKHHLEGKAVYYYSSFDHSKWYMLVYGQYNTVKEAHEAINNLPPELKKLQPWIKPVRDVKAEIKTRHLVS